MLRSWLVRGLFGTRPLVGRRPPRRACPQLCRLEDRLTPSDCPLIEGQPATVLVADIADGNPNVTAADFTATTRWSDGVTTQDRIVPQGSGPGFRAFVYATRTF
jgi:hypothetical protein